MSIFPVTAQTPSVFDYLENFGKSYNNEDLTRIQLDILSDNNIVPLAFESQNIAYSELLQNVDLKYGGGALDIALIVKNDNWFIDNIITYKNIPMV